MGQVASFVRAVGSFNRNVWEVYVGRARIRVCVLFKPSLELNVREMRSNLKCEREKKYDWLKKEMKFIYSCKLWRFI